MKKLELLEKVRQLDGLSSDEYSYLINTKKKYGLVWEDKPEDVEEELRTKLPVLKEVKERVIINDTADENYPNHILIEGVIVPKESLDDRLWKYAENRISASNDTTGWSVYNPSAFHSNN